MGLTDAGRGTEVLTGPMDVARGTEVSTGLTDVVRSTETFGWIPLSDIIFHCHQNNMTQGCTSKITAKYACKTLNRHPQKIASNN